MPDPRGSVMSHLFFFFLLCSALKFLFQCVCSVFWDLYCAAPERRDTCEHSSEAKAFHDYVSVRRCSFSFSFWLLGTLRLIEKSMLEGAIL